MILTTFIHFETSGLLVAYLALRNMEKKNGELPLFMYYFHRFWRYKHGYDIVFFYFFSEDGNIIFRV